MPERLSLANAFDPPSGADITADAAKTQQALTTIRQLAQAKKNDDLVKATIQAATTKDPVSGTIATDQAKVIQNLRLKDPQVAEAYERHVEDITAEKTTRALAAAKAGQEQTTFNQGQQDRAHKLVLDTLSAVDENGDQTQAAADYATGVAQLKRQGVAVPPEDEVYSKGKVALWKRQLVGAGEIYKTGAKLQEDQAKGDNAITVAKIRGGSTIDAAKIHAGATMGAAQIGANARIQAAGMLGKGSATDDDDTIDFLAQQYNLTGTLPALGNGQGGFKRRILTKATQLAKSAGISAGDVVANKAATAANKTSLGKQQTNTDTIEAAEQTALANGQQFIDRSKELTGQTRSPLANSVINAGKRHITGDPTIAAADAALNTFSGEYARVVSSSPSGAGQLTDSARHEALNIMNGNYSYAQKLKAFSQLKADMRNRVTAAQNQLQGIRQRTSIGSVGVVNPQGGAIVVKSSSDYANAPSGSTVIWNGKKYVKP